MDAVIRVFEKDSDEYNKLERMATILALMSPNKYEYSVDETYFDFGQDWTWTTIICKGGQWGGYQALNPAEQERVIFSDGSIEELLKIAKDVFADKFCPDRISVR